MTNLQKGLQRACEELGLTIQVPFVLTVRDGIQIKAQALLPQIGHDNGTIILSHDDDLRGVEGELDGLGYYYCVLSEPRDEIYDLESYIKMFSDWGWGNTNEEKPDWMVGDDLNMTVQEMEIRVILQIALLGAVPPQLRAVAFSFDETDIHIDFYFEGAIADEDRGLMFGVVTNLYGRFLDTHEITRTMHRLDYPRSIPEGNGFVFLRMEDTSRWI